jgi:hypothetical protein
MKFLANIIKSQMEDLRVSNDLIPSYSKSNNILVMFRTILFRSIMTSQLLILPLFHVGLK